jgi:hypothetical protein
MDFLNNFATSFSTSTNKAAIQIWTNLGIISWKGRDTRGQFDLSPLDSEHTPINLFVADGPSGTPVPLPASKQSHFLCATLGSAFSNALKTKSKTAASNLATVMENRYSNFRQECGQAQMQRLDGDPGRLFCDDIAKIFIRQHQSTRHGKKRIRTN